MQPRVSSQAVLKFRNCAGLRARTLRRRALLSGLMQHWLRARDLVAVRGRGRLEELPAVAAEAEAVAGAMATATGRAMDPDSEDMEVAYAAAAAKVRARSKPGMFVPGLAHGGTLEVSETPRPLGSGGDEQYTNLSPATPTVGMRWLGGGSF